MVPEPESEHEGPVPEPPASSDATGTPKAATPAADGPAASPRDRRSIIEAVADLLQFIVDWLRQEAEAAVREKVVRPLQRLGLTVASGFAAGCLLVLGIAYISVAAFMLLAGWITYPGALLLVGGLLVLGSVIFTAIKMRSMQK